MDKPAFDGAITDRQADVIIHTLWDTFVNLPIPRTIAAGNVSREQSQIASFVCVAVHADITLQPLHGAYRRKFYPDPR